MKVRYLIPLVVVGVVGCGPRDISTLSELDDGVENGFLDGTVVSPNNQKPYSGPVLSGEDNWNGRLNDGLLDGPWERYYENGQLRQKGSYSNGEIDGLWVTYWENGQLRSKGSFSNGQYDGPWETYDENGQFQLKGSFSNGEQCGEWIENGGTPTYPPCPNG